VAVTYWVVKAILTPLLYGLFKVKPEGKQHVPAQGACILASNHLSFSDSIFLPLILRRRITFVAKAEYFDDPKTAWFFRAVGQIPIRRGGGSASQRALDSAMDVLRGGRLFGIYPEGTRSPDGRLYRGKTGVARMALESGAVVIPCAMVNTEIIQPAGRLIPKLRPRPGVVFGKALDFSRYEGMSGDRFVERSMTDEIMYELMQLSGQEYVDQYAAKVKKAQGRDAGFGARDKAGVRELGDRIPDTQAS
jgi:1-acyl-sn-glycerol-3-phosphate acyltransferase